MINQNFSITDANGSMLQQLNYNMWSKRSIAGGNYSSCLFDRGFTGHEHLDMFGLINMNGRVYDPLLDRFLSPDKYVQGGGSQAFNRYTYCRNNPLKYTDPSGWDFWDSWWMTAFKYKHFTQIVNPLEFDFGSSGGGNSAGGSTVGITVWEKALKKIEAMLDLMEINTDDSDNSGSLDGHSQITQAELHVKLDPGQVEFFDLNSFSSGGGTQTGTIAAYGKVFDWLSYDDRNGYISGISQEIKITILAAAHGTDDWNSLGNVTLMEDNGNYYPQNGFRYENGMGGLDFRARIENISPNNRTTFADLIFTSASGTDFPFNLTGENWTTIKGYKGDKMLQFGNYLWWHH